MYQQNLAVGVWISVCGLFVEDFFTILYGTYGTIRVFILYLCRSGQSILMSSSLSDGVLFSKVLCERAVAYAHKIQKITYKLLTLMTNRNIGVALMVAHEFVAFGLFCGPLSFLWEKLLKIEHKSYWLKSFSRLIVTWFAVLVSQHYLVAGVDQMRILDLGVYVPDIGPAPWIT